MFLTSFVSKIDHFFQSGEAKKALQTTAEIVQYAAPIVQQIEAVAPNKTVEQVLSAYNKYGVTPTSAIAAGDATQMGNALLNLATTVLSKNLPVDKAGASTTILNTAVQLAVLALKK
jgi:hypothetical protein